MLRTIIGLVATTLVFTASQAIAQIPRDLERDLARAFQTHSADNTYIDSLTSGDEAHPVQCMASIMIMSNLIYQNRESAMRINAQLTEARLQNVFWHWLHAHTLAQPAPNILDLRNAAMARSAAASASSEATVAKMRHLADCRVQPAWLSAPSSTPHLRSVMAGAGFIPQQFAVPDAQRAVLRTLNGFQISALDLLPRPVEPADSSNEAIDAALNQTYAAPRYVEARGGLVESCLSRSASFINYTQDDTDPQLRLSPSPTYMVLCERLPSSGSRCSLWKV